MQWHSVGEFLDMGGYALYVWGSFGITALVMAIEIWQVRAKRRAVLHSLSTDIVSDQDSSEDQE